MDLLLAIIGGGIVAGVASFFGYARGFDAAKREADVVIAGWKERAERNARSWSNVAKLKPLRRSFDKPQYNPITVHDALRRTAFGKCVPIEAVEDWSLEHRELAYLWALQTIGGRDMPAPLCVMVHVPTPGERR